MKKTLIIFIMSISFLSFTSSSELSYESMEFEAISATASCPACVDHAFDMVEIYYALGGTDGFTAGQIFDNSYDSCAAVHFTCGTANRLDPPGN